MLPLLFFRHGVKLCFLCMKTYFFRAATLYIFFLGFLPLTAQDMAYPIEGDGVLSFLRR